MASSRDIAAGSIGPPVQFLPRRGVLRTSSRSFLLCMSTLAPAAPRVEPALVVEYCAPAVSYVTAAPVDEYIASMPAVDAAPTQVVKYMSLALGGFATPAMPHQHLSWKASFQLPQCCACGACHQDRSVLDQLGPRRARVVVAIVRFLNCRLVRACSSPAGASSCCGRIGEIRVGTRDD